MRPVYSYNEVYLVLNIELCEFPIITNNFLASPLPLHTTQKSDQHGPKRRKKGGSQLASKKKGGGPPLGGGFAALFLFGTQVYPFELFHYVVLPYFDLFHINWQQN